LGSKLYRQNLFQDLNGHRCRQKAKGNYIGQGVELLAEWSAGIQKPRQCTIEKIKQKANTNGQDDLDFGPGV
jgi:hypothetical protein